MNAHEHILITTLHIDDQPFDKLGPINEVTLIRQYVRTTPMIAYFEVNFDHSLKYRVRTPFSS